MTRPIDADAIVAEIEERLQYVRQRRKLVANDVRLYMIEGARVGELTRIESYIKTLPIIDEKNVRCEDCRWAYCESGVIRCCTLHKGLLGITPDSFCSYGRRRKSNDETEES